MHDTKRYNSDAAQIATAIMIGVILGLAIPATWILWTQQHEWKVQ